MQNEEKSGLLFSPQPQFEEEIASGLFKVEQLEQRAREARPRKVDEESSGLVDINEIIDPAASSKGGLPIAPLTPPLEPIRQAPDPRPDPPASSRPLLLTITALMLVLLGLLTFLALG